MIVARDPLPSRIPSEEQRSHETCVSRRAVRCAGRLRLCTSPTSSESMRKRRLGDRLPVLRVTAGSDPGHAVLPHLRGVPGTLGLSRAHEEGQAQDPRTERCSPLCDRAHHRSLRVHPAGVGVAPPHHAGSSARAPRGGRDGPLSLDRPFTACRCAPSGTAAGRAVVRRPAAGSAGCRRRRSD